jgi:type II secretory pathway predicted ATPase ExeA
MYEQYYGLREKPFTIQPDPEFLFMGKRHSLAYAMLEYGIENRAAFSVICGEIGSGKTTLIRHLLNNLGPEFEVGIVYNTSKLIHDLMEWILLAFNQPYQKMSEVALFDQFQNFLIDNYGKGKRTILIVDEAQNLSPLALESLRMLSNINADKDQLLQVILVGQPQLRTLLRRPELQQFFQRVSVDYFIPALKAEEVQKYIEHRLSVAGRDKPLFTQDAYKRIAEATEGVPRRINTLCDTTLVYGMSSQADIVNSDLVNEVLEDKDDYGVFTSQTL